MWQKQDEAYPNLYLVGYRIKSIYLHWHWNDINFDSNTFVITAQIANFMGPTWDPPGSWWPQMGPMLAPWTLLLGWLLWRWPWWQLPVEPVSSKFLSWQCFYFSSDNVYSNYLFLTNKTDFQLVSLHTDTFWKWVHVLIYRYTCDNNLNCMCMYTCRIHYVSKYHIFVHHCDIRYQGLKLYMAMYYSNTLLAMPFGIL